MANNRTRKERLSQEQKMAASHVVQIHTHARFPRSKKWPTYHVAVPTGNALASQRSIFRENHLNFRPSSAAEKVSIVCGTNNHVKSEMLSNRHTDTQTDTQTHRPSTVTLAAHARRGLITMLHVTRNVCSKHQVLFAHAGGSGTWLASALITIFMTLLSVFIADVSHL